MRRIAVFVLFALVAPTLTALTGSSEEDCCSTGGEMSCCVKESVPEAGCGLRRCAPDSERGFVPQVPRAILASASAVTPFIVVAPASSGGLRLPGFDPDRPAGPAAPRLTSSSRP